MAHAGVGAKTKRDDFLMQGSILAIAAVITRVIGAIYRIPLVRILGDEGMGIYGVAFEIYAMALILSSLSLPIAVSKLVSARQSVGEYRNAYRVFRCSLVFAVIVGAIFSLALFIFANWFSENMMNHSIGVYALRVIAPAVFIVAVLGVLRGYFQGLGTMVPTAVSQVLEQIVNGIVSVAGAFVLLGIGARVAGERVTGLVADAGEYAIVLLGAAYGAAGGMLGTVAGALAALLLLIWLFRMYKDVINRRLKRDQSSRRESYGHILPILILTIIPVVLSTTMYNINQIIGYIMFANIMEAQGVPEVEFLALQGIFAGSYNVLINIPLAMASGFAASIIPSLTSAIVNKKRKQINRKINQITRFIVLVSAPCFIGFIVLASPIMYLLFANPDRLPANMLMMGSITVVLYSWATVSNSVLQGLDKMREPVINAIYALIAYIVSLWLMLVVFQIGVYALVLSNVVSATCMCYFNMRSIRKASNYRQEWTQSVVRPLIAAVIMGMVAFLVQVFFQLFLSARVATVIAILVAMVVYGIGVLQLGALSASDVKGFPQGKKILQILRKLRLAPKI